LPDLEEIRVHLCDRCEGAWYPLGSLSAVGQTSRLSVAQTDLSVSLIPDKKTDLEATARCPVCADTMSRFTFSLAPEVKLDECLEHGTWLDDGELGTILDSIAEVHADMASFRQSKDGHQSEPFAFTARVLKALLSRA
jgi:Zn-finger nucleic acid-binding protein